MGLVGLKECNLGFRHNKKRKQPEKKVYLPNSVKFMCLLLLMTWESVVLCHLCRLRRNTAFCRFYFPTIRPYLLSIKTT